MKTQEYTKDGFTISTNRGKLDLYTVHRFLTEAYWSKGITREKIKKSIDNSLCFGVYEGKKQIGFARVISDFSSFAYIADVFIIEEYRGRGLAKWLMECILKHPELQELKSMMLATKDANGL